ncbi:MAG: PQQ-like beta-propeller repeat protein [Planctomycetes bacterium]|nr:PQQ-like beta-propeller repeat protein [Planctomycetota bacterium]
MTVVMTTATVTRAADWPQFRGPERNGNSPETGLMQSWPEGGPKELWSSDDVGHGWASVAVVGGKVYTTGVFGDELRVTALDASGKTLWQKPIDKATGGGGFKGARPTPTVDGDRLYVLSDAGRLVCLERDGGKEVWGVDVLKEYGAENARHSLGESVLVDGRRVICTPAGKASVVALDKTTGKQLWAAPPVDPRTAYVSAQVTDCGGVRQIVAMTGKILFGVTDDGSKVLWTHPRETPWEVNINAPHIRDGVLYVSSGGKFGTEALKLVAADGEVRVQPLWNSKELDDNLGGMALVGERLIGCCSELPKGLTALDIRTGKQVYKNAAIGESSIIVGDGRLYCLEHTGRMLLVNPVDGSVCGSFGLPKARKSQERLWAHPAISDGRLYVRHESTVSVYDIKTP